SLAQPADQYVDTAIERLRKRLGDGPREPTIIKTVRGEGYVLSARVSHKAPGQ
ncbi:MAG: helix-turn-helix domain-containing protein, partial [Sedimenticola sp.]